MTNLAQQYLEAIIENGEEQFTMDVEDYDTFSFTLEEVY